MSMFIDVASVASEVQQDTTPEGAHQVNKYETIQVSISTLPPELLQSVFRHLPFYDLLRCQRVCYQWRAYLPGNDPTLQRRTFSKAPIARTLPDIHVFINRESWPQYSSVFRINIIFRHWTPDIAFHPLVQSFAEDILRQYLGFAGTPVERRSIEGIQRYCGWDDCRFAKAKPKPTDTDVTPSWVSMLFCAPAIPQVRFWIHRPAKVGVKDYSRICKAKEDKPGVTFGQVMQAIREELELSQEALSLRPKA